MDVWQYIHDKQIELPSLYFAHWRAVVARDGMLLADSPFIGRLPGEEARHQLVRFRTIGDMTCTGAVVSDAATIDDVIAEITVSRFTERGARADDKRAETAMEDRKRLGYF